MLTLYRKTTRIAAAYVALGLATGAAGQTTLRLRTQTKDVDFSAAPSTRPAKTGTSLPSICAVGEMFFLSNATNPGENLYGCTATNTWTLQGDKIPAQGGFGGASMTTDGVQSQWTFLGGDL